MKEGIQPRRPDGTPLPVSPRSLHLVGRTVDRRPADFPRAPGEDEALDGQPYGDPEVTIAEEEAAADVFGLAVGNSDAVNGDH